MAELTLQQAREELEARGGEAARLVLDALDDTEDRLGRFKRTADKFREAWRETSEELNETRCDLDSCRKTNEELALELRGECPAGAEKQTHLTHPTEFMSAAACGASPEPGLVAPVYPEVTCLACLQAECARLEAALHAEGDDAADTLEAEQQRVAHLERVLRRTRHALNAAIEAE